MSALEALSMTTGYLAATVLGWVLDDKMVLAVMGAALVALNVSVIRGAR